MKTLRTEAETTETTTRPAYASTTLSQSIQAGMAHWGATEAAILAHQGYVAFNPLLNQTFADRMPEIVDQLIAEGYFFAPCDRMVNGQPTEMIVNLGIVGGNGPGAPIFQRSSFIRELWTALQDFGRNYNLQRLEMLETGLVTPQEAPELAVEGMELNVNRVVTLWTGLHPHQDHHRIVPAALLIPTQSVRHTTTRARVFTVTGYARPCGVDGLPKNDLGGALTLYIRRAARQPGDKTTHDVVAANHNTGAAFFAHIRGDFDGEAAGLSRAPEPGEP